MKAMKPLFNTNVTASDPVYMHIRDDNHPKAKAAKELAEELWGRYYPYADNHFLIEIQNDFHSRFWEMYLSCTLMEKGYEIDSRNIGPDIKVIHNSRVIWIEAIAPTGGNVSSRDRVPDLALNTGKAEVVPDEQIILRYCSAIEEKYENKYLSYLKNGIVAVDDCYIIAVNGCKIPCSALDIEPPRILRSVLPIGNQVVSIDKSLKVITDTHFQYKPYVRKKSGSEVNTDIFTNPDYQHLNAIIFSNIDAANPTKSMGEDFIIVQNPLALENVDNELTNMGRVYKAILSENQIIISHPKTPTTLPPHKA